MKQKYGISNTAHSCATQPTHVLSLFHQHIYIFRSSWTPSRCRRRLPNRKRTKCFFRNQTNERHFFLCLSAARMKQTATVGGKETKSKHSTLMTCKEHARNNKLHTNVLLLCVYNTYALYCCDFYSFSSVVYIRIGKW